MTRKADWSCDKLHPVAGDQVNLFIPEQVAERGFSGQLRLMPVVSLCPCQKSFPNQPTRITTASVSFAVIRGCAWMMKGNLPELYSETGGQGMVYSHPTVTVEVNF